MKIIRSLENPLTTLLKRYYSMLKTTDNTFMITCNAVDLSEMKIIVPR